MSLKLTLKIVFKQIKVKFNHNLSQFCNIQIHLWDIWKWQPSIESRSKKSSRTFPKKFDFPEPEMSSRSNRKAGPMTAVSRLRMDYMRLKKDPVPYIVAEPLPSNMLEWHYCVSGPEQSPYFGGIYHGKLVFPAEFPFKPPSIYIITPNGRFKCNTRLCLSM